MEDNRDLRDLSVCIIGLGFIGGSLARVLKEKLGVKSITAVDNNKEQLEYAMKDGVISSGVLYTADNTAKCAANCSADSAAEAFSVSDIIFLCTPHKASLQYLALLASSGVHLRAGCIITDTGSTKSEIIEYASSLRNLDGVFIGGHPMAGSEKTGYKAGYPHLFENAYYILTPQKKADTSADYKGKLELMKSLLCGIGAIPIVMEASEHDRVMAAISHLPHIIASTLVNLIDTLDTDSSGNGCADAAGTRSGGRMKMLAAGGFKDITRIASSDPFMWEGISASNAGFISEMLDSYISTLNSFKEKLNRQSPGLLADFFAKAKTYRDKLPNTGLGAIRPSYDIIADVVDKPGIIGDIAGLLGKGSINIKNIGIANSRENEYGCLRITLPDERSTNLAIDLLSINGYKVNRC